MKISKRKMTFILTLCFLILTVMLLTAAAPKKAGDVKRGEYLVKVVGCGDCHTPLKMTPSGPVPDESRMLSGHPEALVIHTAPTIPGTPWMGIFTGTMTGWAGPWGVSFSANLTPDKQGGLGVWTQQEFMDALRNGKHLGKGRPILPPMPWEDLKNLTDSDLKAIFAYLQTIPTITNNVPQPILAPEPTAK